MKNKFEFLKDILNKSNNETVIINRGEFLDSSVLIIITKINDEYNVIFEKRAKEIRQSGEICFPGGIKSKEDQNYLDTALRECEEEIGINRKNIDILGGLGTFIMGGKVIIDVFIGFCDYENIKNCILNYDEVEKIITVPVKFFMENKANIQIKEMPEMQIASVLSIGVQNIGNAYNTLISWAISKNIFPRENVKMITVYHDSFKVTAPNKVRIHAGMLLEEAIKNEGEVFLEILPKGKYIVSRQEITLPEFETAWNALFLWMNENGHQFRKECPYEIYHNDYQEHPEKKCLVDFCIPIL
jgi:DNA gyrase inhibitor GyrI/8-oxo-dGTP pyrophosphatase MutT (NUDIX family)